MQKCRAFKKCHYSEHTRLIYHLVLTGSCNITYTCQLQFHQKVPWQMLKFWTGFMLLACYRGAIQVDTSSHAYVKAELSALYWGGEHIVKMCMQSLDYFNHKLLTKNVLSLPIWYVTKAVRKHSAVYTALPFKWKWWDMRKT